jgi:hypothetical protein
LEDIKVEDRLVSMRHLSVTIASLLAAATVTGAALAGVYRTLPHPEHWRVWWCCATLTKDGSSATLWTDAPTTPDVTHSALVVGSSIWDDQTISFTTTTQKQLRTGSAPNPWETGWVMFHFRDPKHYYWFLLKTNGFELGKKQGSYTQIFLQTGDAPALVPGEPVSVQVLVRGARIRASVDGRQIVDYTDPNPLPAGSVALYEEDSRVSFESVALSA